VYHKTKPKNRQHKLAIFSGREGLFIDHFALDRLVFAIRLSTSAITSLCRLFLGSFLIFNSRRINISSKFKLTRLVILNGSRTLKSIN